jgi:hypothetical protein
VLGRPDRRMDSSGALAAQGMRNRPLARRHAARTFDVKQNDGDAVEWFQDSPLYKPGDVVNGHVLGPDNIWHLLTSMQSPKPVRGYWSRYAGRWPKTYLVMAVMGTLSYLGTASNEGRTLGLLTIILAATVMAGFYASLINLVVAAFPARR